MHWAHISTKADVKIKAQVKHMKRERPQEIDEALVQHAHTHTNLSEQLWYRKALIHRPAAAMSP